jgi:cytochrome P450
MMSAAPCTSNQLLGVVNGYEIKIDSRFLYLILGIVSTLTTIHISSWNRNGERKNRTLSIAENTKKKRKNVPYAPGVGLFETIREFGGVHCPLFLLKLSRGVFQQSSGLNCFRLSLPIPGGMYIVNDITIIRKILTDPTTDRSASYKVLNKILDTQESLFTSPNNDHWKMVRKLTSPAFATSEVKRMKDIIKRLTEEWCAKASVDFTETPYSPEKEAVGLTFRIICEAAFEYEVTGDDFQVFTVALHKAMQEFNKQVANPLRGTLLGKMIYKEAREADKASLVLRGFAQRILHSYRTKPHKSTQSTLIKLIESSDQIESDKQRVAEMLVYLVAGHDTTGYTISNLLVFLAKNRNALEKLRVDTEILLPEEWSQKSQYFQFCIKETHRLLPVAALSAGRLLGVDYTVGGSNDDCEYIIPKGATVILPQVTPGRNNQVFSNADTFDPERWYTATPEMNDAIMPFVVGNRNCVGQSLALAEIDVIVPTILSHFDVHMVQDGDMQFFITWKFVNSKLILTKRK